MKTRLAAPLVFLSALLSGSWYLVPGSWVSAAVQTQPRADEAFARFWAARSPAEAASRIDEIASTGITFDETYRRLRAGRTYGRSEQTGLVPLENKTNDGVVHNYVVNVPATYDPSHPYQVRFQLHGGVMMRHSNVPPSSSTGAIGALEGDEQIYIVPYAWDAAPWWSEDQLLNLREMLDVVKRRYNVDENRVVVSGVSDGATGAYYVAMRDTTPYASFLPLNGFYMVLANASLNVDGPLYPNNFRDKPFFIVNGERDPLFPTRVVTPHIEHFKKGGVILEYDPRPGAGHNTRWWPEVRDRFESFVRTHPRDPLPDTLTWETSDTSHNRAHWLVIDKLGQTRGELSELDDLNLMPPTESRLEFGVKSAGNRIIRVIPGSNAERMGVKAGDGLVQLNGESVHIDVEAEEAFEELKPGDRITLLVARDNAPLELSGVFDPKPVMDPPKPLFDRTLPSGRVDLVRSGNTVTMKTRGVAAVTLLLSPDRFDFQKPVKVVANGRTVFEGRVRKDLRTLLKWAAADNDRTMLFGAELHVSLN